VHSLYQLITGKSVLNLVKTFTLKMVFQVETMDFEDYRTAVEAAHVQFAMSLLTPALRIYIETHGDDVDDVDDKDFVECCKFILSNDLVQHRHICFFEDAVNLRNYVSHQNFRSSGENIKSLIRIATCIQREDVADSIREFTVSRKRSDDHISFSPPVRTSTPIRTPTSTPTSSASVSLSSSPSHFSLIFLCDSYEPYDFSLIDFPSLRSPVEYDN
jgi:hypothetical protein